MMRHIKYYFLCLFLFSAAGDTYGQSRDIEEIQSSINRLERDIRALSRQLYNNDKKPNPDSTKTIGNASSPPSGNSYIIRLSDRLAEVKTELQGTTNLIEGLRHDIDELKTRLDKLVGDIDFRLTRLEGSQEKEVVSQPNVGSAPNPPEVKRTESQSGGPIISTTKEGILGQISESSVKMLNSTQSKSQPEIKKNDITGNKAKQKPSLLPDGSPSFQYRHARSILLKTQYDTAELAFKEFIERYPKHKLSPNALYWLGESFYVRKKFLNAADAFLRAYRESPNGVKAPDSLLKLGMSLANLKKKQDACDVFSQLSKDYPDAPENIKKHLKREYRRSDCK